MELIITKAVSIGVQYCAVHDAGKTEVFKSKPRCHRGHSLAVRLDQMEQEG